MPIPHSATGSLCLYLHLTMVLLHVVFVGLGDWESEVNVDVASSAYTLDVKADNGPVFLLGVLSTSSRSMSNLLHVFNKGIHHVWVLYRHNYRTWHFCVFEPYHVPSLFYSRIPCPTAIKCWRVGTGSCCCRSLFRIPTLIWKDLSISVQSKHVATTKGENKK